MTLKPLIRLLNLSVQPLRSHEFTVLLAVFHHWLVVLDLAAGELCALETQIHLVFPAALANTPGWPVVAAPTAPLADKP